MHLQFGRLTTARHFSLSKVAHHNPLGIPTRPSGPAPVLPRRAGPPQKRKIPHVSKVVAVSSAKGGVGKSTIAVNLAFAFALHKSRPRVGLLDLDIFGPSVPKLMGLESSEEPQLSASGAIIPLVNHGLQCMSMGFLLPRSQSPADTSSSSPIAASNADTPVVWRGLMVQKAAQQLLFDVDWRLADNSRQDLDILVIDLPPGTGDVPLTLGQLVEVDSAVIVSTPQDVSLADVRKGVATFRKLNIPLAGIILNMSYFICPSCADSHHLFGTSESFEHVTSHLGLEMLGELPLVPKVSYDSDKGIPYMLSPNTNVQVEQLWRSAMVNAASKIRDAMQ